MILKAVVAVPLVAEVEAEVKAVVVQPDVCGVVRGHPRRWVCLG